MATRLVGSKEGKGKGKGGKGNGNGNEGGEQQRGQVRQGNKGGRCATVTATKRLMAMATRVAGKCQQWLLKL